MTLQTLCQTTLKEPRIKTVIDSKGDTSIQMSLSDAKIILSDLLVKEITDSLLIEYQEKDKVSNDVIILKTEEINKLKIKCGNFEQIIENLKKILINNQIEIDLLNETIKQQKKEIRKQKVLKTIGFIAAVALPITILILTIK